MSGVINSLPPEAPLLPRTLRNTRALWVVLIIMALLAGCALLFARGSMRLSSDWQSQLSDTLTVQLILDQSEDWEEKTSLASATLATELPSADIEILSQEAARELLRPWLGTAKLPDNLPIPGVINMTGENISARRVQAALDAVGMTANVDDNSRYADQLRGTASRFVSISLGTLALILLASLSVNIFATRASMTAQKEITRVLVQVGAGDKFIANLFVRQAFRRGFMGAAIGLSLAVILWVILSMAGDWGGFGWTEMSAGITDIFYLIVLGIIFALICAGAAGYTATRQLAYERKRL